jgi:hypothetical protein
MLTTNDEVLRVAFPRGCNTQQSTETSATIGATPLQRNSLKALAHAALKRNDTRNNDATDTQKDTQQTGEKSGCFVARSEGGFQPLPNPLKPELLAILAGKAGGAEPAPLPPDPLNPTGDPELARLLSLPPGERLVALVQAGYRMEFEAGRLVRVVKLADIEGEPEALAEDQHQGDTDTGRVCCGECARFRRNRIGDPVHGIGRCSIFENPPGGPLWPKAERRCSRFVSIASDGGEA